MEALLSCKWDRYLGICGEKRAGNEDFPCLFLRLPNKGTKRKILFKDRENGAFETRP